MSQPPNSPNRTPAGVAPPSPPTHTTLTPAELRAAVPVLADLSDDDLRMLVDHGEVRTYPDGETIFMEGMPARALYFLVSGSVRIFRNVATGAQLDLVRFEPGAIFGEVALLAGTQRTASSAALGDVTALRVPKEKLLADFTDGTACSKHVLFEVAKLLARRLEAMNRRLVDSVSAQAVGGELEVFKRKMLRDWTI